MISNLHHKKHLSFKVLIRIPTRIGTWIICVQTTPLFLFVLSSTRNLNSEIPLASQLEAYCSKLVISYCVSDVQNYLNKSHFLKININYKMTLTKISSIIDVDLCYVYQSNTVANYMTTYQFTLFFYIMTINFA